jgi:hypothetical protein
MAEGLVTWHAYIKRAPKLPAAAMQKFEEKLAKLLLAFSRFLLL